MKRKTRPQVQASRRKRSSTAPYAAPAGVTVPTPEGTANLLRVRCGVRPRLAIILGSGFHHAESAVKTRLEVSYEELPGFPPTGVRGHHGRLLIGPLRATPVLVLNGRAHFYEGHPMSRVTFPVRSLAAFGIDNLLLTNAAGGINPRFRPGDFMVVTDHINFMGVNPLRGEPALVQERFVDLSRAYDPELSDLLHQAARACGLRVQTGVYLAVSGPSYETPAEIRAFRRLGADAVGMSTVPEVIVARQCGLRVGAVSCITNPAAGLGEALLSHTDVLPTADRVKTTGTLLLKNFVNLYGQAKPSRPCARRGQGA
jgi:purine-nucleoside phosphorylase